jgi:hypothetical protein
MRSTRGILSRALGPALALALLPALALALLLTCGNAAAEWTAVNRGDYIHTPYADKASIHRNGALVRMSGLYDFKRQDFTPDGRGLYSSVVLREYDCAQRQVRLLSVIDFSGRMGAGEAVGTSARVGRWESIVEGGVDDAFWQVACSAR